MSLHFFHLPSLHLFIASPSSLCRFDTDFDPQYFNLLQGKCDSFPNINCSINSGTHISEFMAIIPLLGENHNKIWFREGSAFLWALNTNPSGNKAVAYSCI